MPPQAFELRLILDTPLAPLLEYLQYCTVVEKRHYCPFKLLLTHPHV
jgi:hypothetical protein